MASQIKGARRNLFSESKILHWFVQLALGLHYMHTNRVLHRDLKTQNVFMLGNGRLVLGDLGISKVLDGTMDFAQTCIGTPYCKFYSLLLCWLHLTFLCRHESRDFQKQTLQLQIGRVGSGLRVVRNDDTEPCL